MPGTTTGSPIRGILRGVKRWLLILSMVVACKKAKQEEAPPPPPPAADAAAPVAPDAAPPVDAAAAAAPVVPDAAPGALVAGEAGVGPITETTELDVKKLKAALPGYEIKKVSTPMGDGDLREEYVGVSKGGKLLVKLVGDSTPNTIEIVSDEVWNPFGVTIGMTYADASKLVGPLECSDAGEHTDWKSDIAECSGPKSDRLGFDFTLEGFEAKDVLANPDKLATAKLVAVRWDAPGSGPPGME